MTEEPFVTGESRVIQNPHTMIKFHITTYGWGNNTPRTLKGECNAEGAEALLQLPIWASGRFREWQQTDMSQPLEFIHEMNGGTGRFRCELVK